MHFRRLGVAVVAAAAATAGLAAPAGAEGVRIDDPADADGSLYDVSKLVVRHGPERVHVRVRFDDLRPQGNSGMSIFFDTDPALRGPEFRTGAGLFEGTDYNIGTMTGWRDNQEILECPSRLRLDYQRDRATYWVDNDCFGDVDELRVSIKVKDAGDGSHPVTDWVPERRQFTDWLSRG